MPRLHRLPFTLLAAGLLVPAAAHASVWAPPSSAAPPAASPRLAPAPAPAPAPTGGITNNNTNTNTVSPTISPTITTTVAPETTVSTTTTVAPETTVNVNVALPPAPPPEPAEVTDPAPADEAEAASAATDSPPDAADADEPRPAPEIPEVEEPEYVHVPFNIGVFHPLSINGKHHAQGKKVRNNLSAALGWSRTDRLDGAAATFGLTIVDEVAHGVTWGMIGNLTHGEHHGIQATHGYNHAHDLRGAQFGAINHVHQARGAQFGLLNLSSGRVRGVQFGLVNYAEEADASFALIPVTKKGGIRPEVWTSDTAAINVGLRLPANYTYAFFAGGIHPIARGERPVNTQQAPRSTGTALMAGMGFGGHLPVNEKVALEADVSGWIVSSGLQAAPPVASLTKVRAMVAWQLRPRIALWGGPTVNVMLDRAGGGDVTRPGYGWVSGGYENSDVRMRWWPGFAAGLRF